ncbi:MAG: hypothetical protein K8R17_08470 [Methanosarcinales archaeon]|nr:hypothetical protein [Methanosarcinales archaeon]
MAVNLSFMLESVFVAFWVMVQKPDFAFNELPHQPPCHLLFTLIQLFDRKYFFFAEQFDKCVEE